MNPFKSIRLAYIEDIQQDFDLIGITGFKNYTLEKMDKLKAMCEGGIIPSFPEFDFGDASITWRKPTGSRHRSGDLPAYEDYLGTKTYYKNGNMHRDGGPASINSSENIEKWLKNGEVHREDGPAYTHKGPAFTYLKWAKNNQSYFDNESSYIKEYEEQIKRDFPKAAAAYWAGKLGKDNYIVPKDWDN